MHTYIYDSYLSDKKYFNAVNEIESRLTDLGLGGRVCRLSPLRSLRDVINQELKRNPKTLVVIGNDSIVSQAISLMGGSDVPFGIIPVAEPNNIASRLGIVEEHACPILSARRIVQIDLGVVDNKTFLKSAEIMGDKLRLMIDDNYIVETQGAKVEIVNFLLNEEMGELVAPATYHNGQLHLIITKEVVKRALLKNRTELEQSIIPFTELEIVTEGSTVMLDGFVKINNPQKVFVLPKGLKAIVGKQRNF